MKTHYRWIPYVMGSVGIFILDRSTKFFAITRCVVPYHVNEYVSCELAFNRGMNWGLLHDSSALLFYGITSAIILLTMALSIRLYYRYHALHCVWPDILIIAGSCSNIIDRFLYGGVIDFILLSYGNWSWPLFNIADVCIVGGILWMLFSFYYDKD